MSYEVDDNVDLSSCGRNEGKEKQSWVRVHFQGKTHRDWWEGERNNRKIKCRDRLWCRQSTSIHSFFLLFNTRNSGPKVSLLGGKEKGSRGEDCLASHASGLVSPPLFVSGFCVPSLFHSHRMQGNHTKRKGKKRTCRTRWKGILWDSRLEERHAFLSHPRSLLWLKRQMQDFMSWCQEKGTFVDKRRGCLFLFFFLFAMVMMMVMMTRMLLNRPNDWIEWSGRWS